MEVEVKEVLCFILGWFSIYASSNSVAVSILLLLIVNVKVQM